MKYPNLKFRVEYQKFKSELTELLKSYSTSVEILDKVPKNPVSEPKSATYIDQLLGEESPIYKYLRENCAVSLWEYYQKSGKSSHLVIVCLHPQGLLGIKIRSK